MESLSTTATVRPFQPGDDVAQVSIYNEAAVLPGLFEIARGGAYLQSIGFGYVLKVAMVIDRFHLVPELRRDPLRLEVGSVSIVKNYWLK